MKTRFTAIVTALSIAVSGAAVTPVKAATREQDMLLFLFGAVAGAVIANNVGRTATPTPRRRAVTYSTGPLNVRQTYSFDIDNGRVTSGRGADIWFRAVDHARRFLVPRNGAKIAVGDRSNRGFAGCRAARYSARPVQLRSIPVGSYVCVKTSAGRFSQFRVNAITGGRNKTLRLGYTTWR